MKILKHMFYCDVCNKIEYVGLVDLQRNESKDYPNMTFLEMCGVVDKTLELKTALELSAGETKYEVSEFGVVVSKHKNDKLMLCCKCNTGADSRFAKTSEVSNDEKSVGVLSKYNFISYLDQPVDKIEYCEKSRTGIGIIHKSNKRRNRNAVASCVSAGLMVMAGLTTIRKEEKVVKFKDLLKIQMSEIKKAIKSGNFLPQSKKELEVNLVTLKKL